MGKRFLSGDMLTKLLTIFRIDIKRKREFKMFIGQKELKTRKMRNCATPKLTDSCTPNEEQQNKTKHITRQGVREHSSEETFPPPMPKI